jgi:nucleotide-binding universal stress UspA family protein
MKIETIVVGVDFSDEAEAAVKQALELARHVGGKLTLLHVGVIPETPTGVPESMSSTATAYSRVVKERLEEDRDELEKLRGRISGQGVDVSHAVMDGFPDTGLVEAAKELGADVIVVGTHGRTGIKRFLLGSVAERVVRLSDSSVLVARSKSSSSGGYKKVLVPTDFSDTSLRAISAATQLVAKDGEVHLLNCWQLPPMSGAYYAPVKAADDLFREVRETLAATASSKLDKLVEEYGKDVNMTASELEGAAAHAIQEWIQENEPDLVVTGSHGRRGVRRFLLGSVAEMTVRHSPCSVLVVHSPVEEGEAS